MEITYHEENGYLIPNVVAGCDTTRPIPDAKGVSAGASSDSVWPHGSERNLV